MMIKDQEKYVVPKRDSFLENKKNTLLLALYEKNYQKAEQLTDNILQHIKKTKKSDETSEKLINQMTCLIEKIGSDIQEDRKSVV